MIKDSQIRKKNETSQPWTLRNVRLNSVVEQGKHSDNRWFSVAVSGCDTQEQDSELDSTGRNEVVEDSGASEHAVCDMKLLTEVPRVRNVQAEL